MKHPVDYLFDLLKKEREKELANEELSDEELKKLEALDRFVNSNDKDSI